MVGFAHQERGGRGRRGRGLGGPSWGGRRARASAHGTLLGLTPGEEGVIGHISDDHARAQAVRFGIGDGASVSCISVLPGGPVVVRSGRQEIAIGHGLAARIQVRPSGAVEVVSR